MKWYKQEQQYGLYLDPSQFLIHFVYLFSLSVSENLFFQFGLFLFLHISCRLQSISHDADTDSEFFFQERSFNEAPFQDVSFQYLNFSQVGKAIIVSSFCKLIITFMVIWDFSDLDHAWLINIFVLTSNTEAIYALCRTSLRCRPRTLNNSTSTVSASSTTTSTFFHQYVLLLVVTSHFIKYLFQKVVNHLWDPTYPTYIF